MQEYSKSTYKYCIVPLCKNTNKNAPNKVFFLVPRGADVRKKWCKIMKRDMISPSTCLYCCEDHFDVENDMESYVKYKLVGGQLKLKKGVVPHKFSCQKQSVEKPERSVVKKLKIARLITSSSESIVDSIPRVQDIVNDHLKDVTRDHILCPDDISGCVVGNKNKSNDEPTNTGSDITEDDYVDSEELTDSNADAGVGCVKGEVGLHEGVVCDVCCGVISGFRYTCLQCENFDLCSQCEANESHAHHYVLRVPEPRPYVELQAVLTRLREDLAVVTAASGTGDHNVPNLKDEIKMEVKTDPDEVSDTLSAEILLQNHSSEPLHDTKSLINLQLVRALEMLKKHPRPKQEPTASASAQSHSENDILATTQMLQDSTEEEEEYALSLGLPPDESETVMYLNENQKLELLAHSQQQQQRKRPGPLLLRPRRPKL